MANEDKLGPLAQVMERLAILEEEKNAADARLEEEFLFLRTELEEKYYREKRNILPKFRPTPTLLLRLGPTAVPALKVVPRPYKLEAG